MKFELQEIVCLSENVGETYPIMQKLVGRPLVVIGRFYDNTTFITYYKLYDEESGYQTGYIQEKYINEVINVDSLLNEYKAYLSNLHDFVFSKNEVVKNEIMKKIKAIEIVLKNN